MEMIKMLWINAEIVQNDINSWFKSNLLLLNLNKTQYLEFSTKKIVLQTNWFIIEIIFYITLSLLSVALVRERTIPTSFTYCY